MTHRLGAAVGRASSRAYFEDLRRREYARLDECGETYLDFTGSALYAESHLRAHFHTLKSSVFGNTHSESGPSRASSAAMKIARDRVREFFDADSAEYDVIFTANASAAIKLVAESFPFDEGSELVLSADNHNSVNGIREMALARGAAVNYIGLGEDLRLDEPIGSLDQRGRSLFAYPAQSNFSGVQHPLDFVAAARQRGFHVLLDAAAFVPLNKLSLAEVHPDFVCLSFYKMMGYPTGVGALIARREALAILERPWFAGGTVDYVSVQNRQHRLGSGAARFEDGTPDFLALAALPCGLEYLDSIGMDGVTERSKELTSRLLDALVGLRHGNGCPMVSIYGPSECHRRGATVAFNLLDESGRVLHYEDFERFAAARRIALRGGCFCNPGAAEHAFGFDAARSRACMEQSAQHGFTIAKFASCMRGSVVGAIRVSVGIPTLERDIEVLSAAIEEYLAHSMRHSRVAGIQCLSSTSLDSR